MHVDTARELKALLSRRLSEAPPGAVVASEARDGWSGVALGLAPAGPGQVHLAVRLRAEADASLVLGALDEAARAEVDVRVIGAVRPLRSPTPEQLDRWVVPTIRGERRECYAITEEGAGSDVDAIRATATRDGDSYRLKQKRKAGLVPKAK